MTGSRLLVTALVACSAPVAAPIANTATHSDPAKPPTVAVQLAYRGTFTIGPPFSQVPPFTLLDDGTLIGVADGSVRVATLPRDEVERITRHVVELGFDRLQDHEDSCEHHANGTATCVSDASFTILRVARPAGLREVTSYAGFSNEPAVLENIVAYLEHYKHPAGKLYVPTSAVLHVRVDDTPKPTPCPAIDPALLHLGSDRNMWGFLLDGKPLAQVLAIANKNLGDFVACVGGKRYQIAIMPGVPGADLNEELEIYKR